MTAVRVRLDKALKHFGGRKELAEFLGISVEAIMNWQRDKRKELPELRALQISIHAPGIVEKGRKSKTALT